MIKIELLQVDFLLKPNKCQLEIPTAPLSHVLEVKTGDGMNFSKRASITSHRNHRYGDSTTTRYIHTFARSIGEMFSTVRLTQEKKIQKKKKKTIRTNHCK